MGRAGPLVERETKRKKGMATAPPRLLRGLIAPLSPAYWLPCHQQLLISAALLHRWWLARLRCSDGFNLFLVVLLVSAALAEVRYVASASMAPTLRPGDRAVAEKVSYMHVPAAVCGRHCLLQGAHRRAELWHK
ncbi:hypothetical protein ACQJBY_008298 [Aegilops geniculata]